jgi:hypothetical protein
MPWPCVRACLCVVGIRGGPVPRWQEKEEFVFPVSNPETESLCLTVRRHALRCSL